jgi:hypothetical protein
MTQSVAWGNWEIAYEPEDGGRLSRLKFQNYDLLTQKPLSFHAPSKDFGLFETRAVYGYDDCFPSVDPCPYPTTDWQVPDHGELCWLNWEVAHTAGSLRFHTRSQNLPIEFQRDLRFEESSLIWSFGVRNHGTEDLPFQHVMHPLMPLREITSILLPRFSGAIEDYRKEKPSLESPRDVENWLLGQPEGTAAMLYLQGISAGQVALTLARELRITIVFPQTLFPTIGIWWDNGGYPDEDNCRRVECAFEPTPGSNCRLSEAYREGKCLTVKSGRTTAWEIRWIMDRAGA